MRRRAALFACAPDIECDGEMHGDAALSRRSAAASCPRPRWTGEANLLVLPNLDAANILFNVLKMTGGQGVTVGPMLLGAAAPAHILTPSATVRRVVNMTALAVAGGRRRHEPLVTPSGAAPEPLVAPGGRAR
jgi:malate dehydrogenase (oxaloacetate-decarboxylating)(NADP+)